MSAPNPPGRRFTPPALFDMMLAYKTTAVLGAGIELGVFDCLAGGAADASGIAAAIDVHPRGARLLLNALAALGLVRSDGGAYWLDEDVAGYLVRDRPGYLGDMARVMSSRWEWDALRDLPEAVRRGGTVLSEQAETPGYEYWLDFARYAGTVATPAADTLADVLAGWATGRRRLHVLDVACGHGLYGYTLARRQPQARVWSLDWPNVLPVALDHAERLGLADRVSTIAGDMFEVPLDGPYDVVMITNVLHHFSESRGVELVRRARDALAPRGKLAVVGFTVDDGEPATDPAPHLFSILMLIWTFQGEVHSVSAYQRMLAAGGFTNVSVHRVASSPFRVIVADRT